MRAELPKVAWRLLAAKVDGDRPYWVKKPRWEPQLMGRGGELWTPGEPQVAQCDLGHSEAVPDCPQCLMWVLPAPTVNTAARYFLNLHSRGVALIGGDKTPVIARVGLSGIVTVIRPAVELRAERLELLELFVPDGLTALALERYGVPVTEEDSIPWERFARAAQAGDAGYEPPALPSWANEERMESVSA